MRAHPRGGAVLAAISGPPLWVAVPLLAVAAPVAVRTFVALVPEGTLRLAPGMPAAVLVRGILTFAFFGADAYVSLTFQDVRDQPTWVAGVALTGCTLGWTAGAWVQQRWILTAGPRRVVATGFAFLAVGIAGMFGALGDLPIPLCDRRLVGRRLRHRPGLLTAVGHRARPRRARPGGRRRSSLQLADVLGVALGTGLGGAFVALGDAQGWATRSALELAFPVTLAAALPASSPPAASPPPSPADPAAPIPCVEPGSRVLTHFRRPRLRRRREPGSRPVPAALRTRLRRPERSGEVLVDDVDEAAAGLEGAEVVALHGDAGGEEGGAADGEPRPRGERRR